LSLIKGILVYEIRIPHRNNPAYTCSLDAESGDLITLGFEIEKIELDRSPVRPEGEGSSGGMKGAAGRPGGRNSGMGGNRPSGGVKPDTSGQEFWLKINLAQK
jgi:hypothetical protein